MELTGTFLEKVMVMYAYT